MSEQQEAVMDWNSLHTPVSARFTMRGELQVSQPLDFSSRNCTSLDLASDEELVVDLSTRGRRESEFHAKKDSSFVEMVKRDTNTSSPMFRIANGDVRISEDDRDVRINFETGIAADEARLGHDAVRSYMDERSSDESSCSILSTNNNAVMSSVPSQIPVIFKKSPAATRPFKAYPKDPLSVPLGLVGGISETALSQASNEAYVEFRRQMLAQVVAAKSKRPSLMTSSSKPVQATQPEEAGSPQQPSSSATDLTGKDPAYWERRRRNNEAAKRSRDARRAKEDEIAIRAAFLEQENLKLKYEVAALRSETSRLRCLLYSNS